MKINISNLDKKTTEADLRKAFSAFGTVDSCGLGENKETKQPNQSGWAVMKDEKEANAAIKGLEGSKLGNEKIHVSPSSAAPAASQSAGADNKTRQSGGTGNKPR